MANFLNNFFGINADEEANAYEAQPTPTNTNLATNKKVVSIDHLHTPMRAANTENDQIVLFEPRLYGEAKEIVDELLNHHAVIINFTQMDLKVANKVVDFLNGAVYAIDGEMKRIGEQIFLCVPHDVDVTGKLTTDLKSSNNERL